MPLRPLCFAEYKAASARHEIAEIGRGSSAEARDSEARCGTESMAGDVERLGFELFVWESMLSSPERRLLPVPCCSKCPSSLLTLFASIGTR